MHDSPHCGVAAAFALTCTCAAQSITGIGFLPGDTRSWALDVSADGTVVAGASSMPGMVRATRWTAATGVISLGAPVGAPSLANAVSADGSTLVGSGGLTEGAFRWTLQEGFQQLPYEAQDAQGVSADGAVIVGRGSGRPFRWTAAGGVRDLGLLPGMTQGHALDVSADGAAVIGTSWNGTSNLYARTFRWTEGGGMQDIGVLPGHDMTAGNAISADGAVITGSFGVYGSYSLFRWTEAGGFEDLGRPAGSRMAAGMDLSADGAAIVGVTESQTPGDYSAFLWTSESGIVILDDYLPTIGIDLTGWRLHWARGISADGRVIVGNGTFNGEERGWIVTIPAPGSIVPLFACLTLVRRRSRPARPPT